MLQACLGQLVHANQVTMAHIHLALCYLHISTGQALHYLHSFIISNIHHMCTRHGTHFCSGAHIEARATSQSVAHLLTRM